jgi:hypothetical protein
MKISTEYQLNDFIRALTVKINQIKILRDTGFTIIIIIITILIFVTVRGNLGTNKTCIQYYTHVV